MTRLGRRDGRGVRCARTDGSAASVREQLREQQKKTSRLHRPHPRDGPEDDGDRVFSINERVTG
jgi:hypothetical protein